MATGELFPLAEASGSFSLRVPCPVHHPPNPPPVSSRRGRGSPKSCPTEPCGSSLQLALKNRLCYPRAPVFPRTQRAGNGRAQRFTFAGPPSLPPPPCPCPWGSHPPSSPHRTRLRTQKCCSEAGMFYSWSDRYWQRIAATLLGKLSFNSSSDSFGFCFVVVFCVWFFFFLSNKHTL